jgi:uncharacterized alkaline shock family protein YloU
MSNAPTSTATPEQDRSLDQPPTTGTPGNAVEGRIGSQLSRFGSESRLSRFGDGDPAAGRTTIADIVVEKIAGAAARQVHGVYSMGGRTGSALGAIKEMVTSAPALGQGVTVEVGERQAAVDLDLIVEYGTPIVDVANGVRRNVTQQVSSLTGLEVVEVNIDVLDVHLPQAEPESDTRVQ